MITATKTKPPSAYGESYIKRAKGLQNYKAVEFSVSTALSKGDSEDQITQTLAEILNTISVYLDSKRAQIRDDKLVRRFPQNPPERLPSNRSLGSKDGFTGSHTISCFFDTASLYGIHYNFSVASEKLGDNFEIGGRLHQDSDDTNSYQYMKTLVAQAIQSRVKGLEIAPSEVARKTDTKLGVIEAILNSDFRFDDELYSGDHDSFDFDKAFSLQKVIDIGSRLGLKFNFTVRSNSDDLLNQFAYYCNVNSALTLMS